MYSVVLLMAVTAGSGSADYYRYHGCYGCTGYTSGYGCYGGCYGCYGGGCYGGCYGGHVVHHGCYGCYGGCYGGHVVYQGCCGGCHGVIHSGCCGGVIHGGCCGGIVPGHPGGTDKGKSDKGKSGKGGKGGADIDDEQVNSLQPATIVVSLPADARLTIDGAVTSSTSATRTFVSPALTPGKSYTYTFEAVYKKDGKDVKVSKKVPVQAGKTAQVELNDVVAVASR